MKTQESLYQGNRKGKIKDTRDQGVSALGKAPVICGGYGPHSLLIHPSSPYLLFALQQLLEAPTKISAALCQVLGRRKRRESTCPKELPL